MGKWCGMAGRMPAVPGFAGRMPAVPGLRAGCRRSRGRKLFPNAHLEGIVYPGSLVA